MLTDTINTGIITDTDTNISIPLLLNTNTKRICIAVIELCIVIQPSTKKDKNCS